MTKTKTFFLLFLLLVFFLSVSFSDSTSPALMQLRSEVEKLKKDADLIHGVFGICVVDVKKDSVLLDYNGNIGLIPASSQKTITTAAALCLLGEDYQYQTKLEYDGNIDSANGILEGNIYITGSGDPALSSKYYKCKTDSVCGATSLFADAIQRKGIKKITGAVIADASVFEDEMTPSTWIWGDMGNYYGAGASGLNYKDNLYTVFFKTGMEGDSARIKKIAPSIPGMEITNFVKAGGTADNCYIYGEPYYNKRYAIGFIPPNQIDYEVDGSMPDPSFYCAFELDSILRNNKIEISKKPATVRELKLLKEYQATARKTIFTEYSPSLSSIVYYTNKFSINLYAECLLKTIALKQQKYGGEGEGTSSLTQFWASKGVNTTGMYLNDGCGLSRWNSVTCKQLAVIMKLMTKEKCFKSFYNSLPVHSSSVSAKSGYITRVRSYAGYAKKNNGDLIAFAVIANNYDCTPKEMRMKLENFLDIIGTLQ